MSVTTLKETDAVQSPVFLASGGEMGVRMRAFDWSSTALGPPAEWPQSLKTIVRIMLDSRYAMWMLWGPQLTFFCNDAYLPTVGIKRDWVLGARSDKVWEEIWPDIGPRIERVLAHGQATWDEGLLLFLERSGYTEETYHTFSYSPVSDDAGVVAGMLCVVTEVTERIISERRLSFLGRFGSALAGADSEAEVLAALQRAVAADARDLPFAVTYLFDQEGVARRAGGRVSTDPLRLARMCCRTSCRRDAVADLRDAHRCVCGDGVHPFRANSRSSARSVDGRSAPGACRADRAARAQPIDGVPDCRTQSVSHARRVVRGFSGFDRRATCGRSGGGARPRGGTPQG